MSSVGVWSLESDTIVRSKFRSPGRDNYPTNDFVCDRMVRMEIDGIK